MRAVALTMFAALALDAGAVAAAGAHEFNALSTPITAEGSNHTFTAGTAIIKCSTAQFKYTGATGKFAKITIVPSYEGCLVREVAALVTVVKAKFEFGIVKEIKSNEFSLSSAIVGETGAELKVTATIEGEECEVVFPAQTITGEATKFVNNAGKTGGEVKAKLEKVEYKSNSKCAGLVGSEGKNGKYEGAASETGLIIE
jgi:polyisoprenoid-binding protein YceI